LGLPSRIFEKKNRKGEKGDEITRIDGSVSQMFLSADIRPHLSTYRYLIATGIE
jgi:hypothetical protein